jgi:hypothetical protein
LAELRPHALEPFLYDGLGGRRPWDAPDAEASYARVREAMMAELRERAGRHLQDFFEKHCGLVCALGDDTLLRLIAANPVATSRAGITAPSPAAWAVRLVRELAEGIKRVAGLGHLDLSADALPPDRRDAIVGRWAEIRHGLALLALLPDREQVRAEVEGDVAAAAVEMERAEGQRRIAESLATAAAARRDGSPPEDGPSSQGKFFLDGVEYDFGRAPLQWRLIKALWQKGPVQEGAVIEEVYGEDAEGEEGKLRKLQDDTNEKLLKLKLPFAITRPMDSHLELQRLRGTKPR